MKFIRNMFLLVIVAALFVFCYSIYIEPNLLIVKQFDYTLTENENKPTSEINVAQFSDTHIGDFYSFEQLEKVISKINELEPDIIVFTGDLFDEGATDAEIEKATELLSDLSAPLGKFAIYGNRDVGANMYQCYDDIMYASGFTLLVNNSKTITLDNEKTLIVFGLDDGVFGNPDISLANSYLQSNEPTLMLVHEPDIALDFEEVNQSLILGGHSHGGQIYIPGIGALSSTTLAETYVKGWYSTPNSSTENIYVHTGLGNTKLPYRLGNIPHIAYFTITL